jgi:hypothetical protein
MPIKVIIMVFHFTFIFSNNLLVTCMLVILELKQIIYLCEQNSVLLCSIDKCIFLPRIPLYKGAVITFFELMLTIKCIILCGCFYYIFCF